MSINKSTTIGGREFSFGYIPPTISIKVQVMVANVIGEPLLKALVGEPEALKALKGGAADEALKVKMAQSMVSVIGLMTTRMSAEDIVECMSIVFKYGSVDSKRIDIEADFVGRPRDMWQAFIYGLRFNFSDFIPAALTDFVR